MTPEELERRATPILPLIEDDLDALEEHGCIVVVERERAICILAGQMLAFLDKRHKLPKGVVR